VGERPFLLRALDEHRDRRPYALIEEDHESLILIAKKNGEPAAGRSYGTGSARRQRAYPYCESLFAFTPIPHCCPTPMTVSGTLKQPEVSPDLLQAQDLPHRRITQRGEAHQQVGQFQGRHPFCRSSHPPLQDFGDVENRHKIARNDKTVVEKVLIILCKVNRV
jgi:hypothetical protein